MLYLFPKRNFGKEDRPVEFRVIVVKPAADEAWITLRVGNRLYPLMYVRREVLAHEKPEK